MRRMPAAKPTRRQWVTHGGVRLPRADRVRPHDEDAAREEAESEDGGGDDPAPAAGQEATVRDEQEGHGEPGQGEGPAAERRERTDQLGGAHRSGAVLEQDPAAVRLGRPVTRRWWTPYCC